jgi:hypothetical protein
MENKNLPAFPLSVAANEARLFSTFDANGGHEMAGLTKREHFAAMILQGICANPAPGNFTLNAKMAVEQADALLAELGK